ncbi:MAG: alkaline phosphatase [Ruminococcaceae bacterium]|nr:alkaline phosphatase [Oscillospiraceae bacterium]
MKKSIAILLLLSLMVSLLVMGCGQTPAEGGTPTDGGLQPGGKLPKYIFLFIGDGMSYPQIQVTNYYMTVQANGGEYPNPLQSQSNLSFMNFPVSGSAQTYDRSSFAPDSSSTATAIATGNKTYSGYLNVGVNGFDKYETIAEKLKSQKDYKIGIVSSVNINHATPGAFYAHQTSRTKYFHIGKELVKSGFDYFAGGAFLAPEPEPMSPEKDLYTQAAEAGYKVVKTQAEAAALKPGDGKAIVIAEHLVKTDMDFVDAMDYEIDRQEGEWALADYVSKGIEMLDNENGFFMMVEGGKVDWACHANDAATAIHEVIALDNAVKKAIEFYNQHPDETLIIVTGDHETGGISIGYAGTDYDTFLNNLDSQKVSYATFNNDYVAKYRENKTDFNTVMADITALFGLTVPANFAGEPKDGSLELSEYEYGLLLAAYEKTINFGPDTASDQKEELLYDKYEPLTVTVTHILANKSGLNFSSYVHTGLPAAVFAIGAGAELFDGYYDNTDIFNKMKELTSVQ